MSGSAKEWRLKALTDLWTGDADRNGGRTIPTGLLGSLRWWFEVLLRGLGGAACDPSDPNGRCPVQQGKRCVVCELFGCTGWGRKFRFEVRDGSGGIMSKQIKKDTEFTLRFTPLRPVAAEEWALLDLTIRLIADYAALGGRTVLRPSDEVNRSGSRQHRDYGIIEVEERPTLKPVSRAEIERYVCDNRLRKPEQEDFSWASLTNFWCVNGKHLARQDASHSTFNKVLGRMEPKKQGQQLASNNTVNQWLAGKQQESKKVFSFQDPPRTFGFVKREVITFEQMKQRLEQEWRSLGPNDFVTGGAILTRLTTQNGAVP